MCLHVQPNGVQVAESQLQTRPHSQQQWSLEVGECRALTATHGERGAYGIERLYVVDVPFQK